MKCCALIYNSELGTCIIVSDDTNTDKKDSVGHDKDGKEGKAEAGSGPQAGDRDG